MKKRRIAKKLIALLMCAYIVVAPASLSISAVADSSSNIVKRRVLIMSAPYDAGPITRNNTLAIKAAFTSNNNDIVGSDYKYTINSFTNNQTGHTTTTFLNTITSVLGGADSNDISYIYINAHGATNGALAVNGAASTDLLSLAALRQRLDTIQGKIVLMIDACHSGNAIENNRTANTNDLETNDISQMMVDEFLNANDRSGEFAGLQKYCVLCSCRPIEDSYIYSFESGSHSGECIMTATYAWARVLGYDFSNGTYTSSFPDDSRGDNVINSNELVTAVNGYVDDYSSPGFIQHPTFYLHNKMTSVFYKNYMTGDINMDKQVTTADLLKLNQYLNGSTTLSTTAKRLADTTQNGSVNTADKTELQAFLSGTATF